MCAEFRNVQNASVSGEFQLTHEVARASLFKTVVETADIKTSGSTKLGRFFVQNNTRDGFSLTIESASNGTMAPSGSSVATTGDTGPDGEKAIPYGIKIEKDGTVGTGIDSKLNHSTNDLNAGAVSILNTAGDSVSSGTDSEFTLYVEVNDDTNVMEMAGTYADTLTITYTDL